MNIFVRSEFGAISSNLIWMTTFARFAQRKQASRLSLTSSKHFCPSCRYRQSFARINCAHMSYLLVTRAEMPLLAADECALLHGEDDLKTVLVYANLRDIRKLIGTIDCGSLTIEHAGDTAL